VQNVRFGRWSIEVPRSRVIAIRQDFTKTPVSGFERSMIRSISAQSVKVSDDTARTDCGSRCRRSKPAKLPVRQHFARWIRTA
jgi:hypothetical protein